jgi:hypothetical protein
MVARFPGMSRKDFVKLLTTHMEANCRIILHRDLRDSAYFQLGHPYDYFEIIHTSPTVLKRIHTSLTTEAKDYYATIEISKLKPYDKLFYMNTEQPFRFVTTTTNLFSSMYNLSCRYNVPLIGGATVDFSKLDDDFPKDYLPENFLPNCLTRHTIRGLNANPGVKLSQVTVETGFNNNLASITKNEHVSFIQNLTMLSYDIETYTPFNDAGKTIDINSYDIQEIARDNDCCEIMTIGIGMFHLNNTTPFKRYCLITRDVTTDENSRAYLKLHKLVPQQLPKKECLRTRLTYRIKGEYNNADNDYTDYVICKDEKDLLQAFIDIMHLHHPHIISAFNNFIFDDRYVYQRIMNYSMRTTKKSKRIDCSDSYFADTLLDQFINAFSPYRILYYNSKHCKFMSNDDEETLDAGEEIHFGYSPMNAFIPKFETFQLKIDGEPYKNQKTLRSFHVISTDIYKIMLKEDAKRFTQDGYGNLKTMLSVYDVKNPYNNEPLSKTDMNIQDMFQFWANGINTYEIGLYCTQDAWICGTLIVKRNKFIDLIEMATMSNTSFKDSVYRADGIRVSNCVLGYGYANHFAVMDNTLEERARKIEETMSSDAKANKKKNKKNQSDLDKDKEKKQRSLDTRPMGAKTFDWRTIVGGQVKQIKAGREYGVVASDYSSMYPSNKEASNADSSSRVDNYVIEHLDEFGLECVKCVEINDMYGIGNDKTSANMTDDDLEYIIEPRHILYVKAVESTSKTTSQE